MTRRVVHSFVLALSIAFGTAPLATPAAVADPAPGKSSKNAARNSGVPVVRQAQWLEAGEPPVPRTPSGHPDFPALATYAHPAVVSIVATPKEPFEDTENPSARQFFERFYGGDEPNGRGMASGFIIRSDGYILTNGHVVEDAATVAITIGDDEGRTFPAVVVGRDDLSDLALLKIEADRPLHALALGDSDTLRVGDWVTAIGNPFGLSQTVTVGVVSFLGRRDVNPSGRPGYYDFIQTDASINPGNSGGPLIDGDGRVIGISAAVNANGQGIAFAIPVNMAKDVLPALFGKGHVERSFLGVSIQDLTPELAESFGLNGGRGVVVTEVASSGPARNAGLEVGDVITAFGGESIAHSHRLRWLASGAGVGKTVAIDLLRQGKRRTLNVTLDALPGTAHQRFKRAAEIKARPELQPLGFAVDGKANASAPGLHVVEVDPTSRAYVAGLREGDLVMEIDGTPLSAPSDLRKATGKAKDAPYRLFIRRGNKPMYLAFRPSS